ncbi:hypothetical protein QQX98_011416 [Neonectria punicea]|uniref:Uncharacterized protein n=1 Tax=Neonectria punicea TaxID=979145 RepID=A0ABR1GLW2_9HYPO
MRQEQEQKPEYEPPEKQLEILKEAMERAMKEVEERDKKIRARFESIWKPTMSFRNIASNLHCEHIIPYLNKISLP